jgi:60 kDa SS-A/Ro ribonucleoprotein
MSQYLRNALGSRHMTQQTAPIPGREADMTANSAGGFVFPVDDFARLRRFLILGSEGGSFYIREQPLTRENAEAVIRCLAHDGPRAVQIITEISEQGRAPKQGPTLYALALACTPSYADERTRAAAFAALPRVVRTGTHLFTFCSFVDDLRGWGQGLKRAIARWYSAKDDDALAYQLVKYRQREGWTHRDVLRSAHPRDGVSNPWRAALYDWACGRGTPDDEFSYPQAIKAFERAQRAGSPREIVGLIERFGNTLPHEAIPTQFKADPSVWAALLEAGMPMGAMLRNLKNMTVHGTLRPLSEAERIVVESFKDAELVRKSRLHPMSILIALSTYANGGAPVRSWFGPGYTSRETWDPNRRVVDALNTAFYSAFPNVEPAGRRFALGIDVSGSMGAPLGHSPLSCAEGAGAMAMAIEYAEPRVHTLGFATDIRDLGITHRDTLDQTMRRISGLNFGGTDASALMRHCLRKGIEVDTFVVLTDNETYAGSIHPSQAVKQYRRETGIDARLAVVGMVSNGFTIADPRDAGMLDVVGFDSATPAIISDFAAERI